jgi:hypothetical protein
MSTANRNPPKQPKTSPLSYKKPARPRKAERDSGGNELPGFRMLSLFADYLATASGHRRQQGILDLALMRRNPT